MQRENTTTILQILHIQAQAHIKILQDPHFKNQVQSFMASTLLSLFYEATLLPGYIPFENLGPK